MLTSKCVTLCRVHLIVGQDEGGELQNVGHGDSTQTQRVSTATTRGAYVAAVCELKCSNEVDQFVDVGTLYTVQNVPSSEYRIFIVHISFQCTSVCNSSCVVLVLPDERQ